MNVARFVIHDRPFFTGGDEMSDGYKTIRGAAQDELEEKKSRFIAQLLPVQTEEEAVGQLRKKLKHAR